MDEGWEGGGNLRQKLQSYYTMVGGLVKEARQKAGNGIAQFVKNVLRLVRQLAECYCLSADIRVWNHPRWDSNPRPSRYEPGALSAELRGHKDLWLRGECTKRTVDVRHKPQVHRLFARELWLLCLLGWGQSPVRLYQKTIGHRKRIVTDDLDKIGYFADYGP